ncbi:hypothetical protein MMC26_005912 [Xylographa opegraphella]|nr:hypothetical protein [Xylographa opegraphella]
MPLPRDLVWLKEHDSMHGCSDFEPPAHAYAALAREYFAMKNLTGWRKAEELYEVAWKLESNSTQRSVWWTRRKEAWDDVQRLCPDPVYEESEEHKRLRMQDIVSKRRQRAKDGVANNFNWYF